MKLIIGLGNPGKEFENSRHNLGFIIVDQLKKKLVLQKELKDKKERFEYIIGTFEEESVLLLKPLTFINNSGFIAKKIIQQFEIATENLLVIYDDLALRLASFKYRREGSSGGHNGMKNIIEELKTEKIQRLRVGIGKKEKIVFKEWVLEEFSLEETKKIKDTYEQILPSILNWINKKLNFEQLMNLYNQKNNSLTYLFF